MYGKFHCKKFILPEVASLSLVLRTVDSVYFDVSRLELCAKFFTAVRFRYKN